MWQPVRDHERLGATLALVVLALAAVWASTATAAFNTSRAATHQISTGTLAAPTSLSAAKGACVALTSTAVNLTWTATTSTFASGYDIRRSTTNGGPYTSIGTAAGQSNTAYTDSTVAFLTTYYYVIQATRNLWRSPNSNQATITTQTIACL
jgi:hypothetical protein